MFVLIFIVLLKCYIHIKFNLTLDFSLSLSITSSAWRSTNWFKCESDDILLGDLLFLAPSKWELLSFSSLSDDSVSEELLLLLLFSSAASSYGLLASGIWTAKVTILFSKVVIFSDLVRLSVTKILISVF